MVEDRWNKREMKLASTKLTDLFTLQRGRRKKEGRKKIAAKFGDKIAAERIACPSGYIKRKTVAWVFAKREVGRVSQWLTSLPRYCPREKKKNKPRPHEISQYKNALCAASNRWFLLWNKCPRRISNRIESNRPVYTSGGSLESRGNVSSMPRRARDDYRRGLQGR